MTTTHVELRPTDRAALAAWYTSVLEDQEDSGLTMTEYAAEIGVTPATLYNWRRRLGSSPSRSSKGSPAGLVRVKVREEAQQPATRTAALVVRLGANRAIEVRPGFCVDELVRVIEVLESC